MKILKVKDCPVCGEIIYKFKYFPFIEKTPHGFNINIFPRPYELNDKGRVFWVLETTGSRMMVSICKECFRQLDDAQVKAIYSSIVFSKLEQIKKMKDKVKAQKLFDLIRVIEVYKWFGEEKDVVNFLKALKDGKAYSSR